MTRPHETATNSIAALHRGLRNFSAKSFSSHEAAVDIRVARTHIFTLTFVATYCTTFDKIVYTLHAHADTVHSTSMNQSFASEKASKLRTF